MISLPIRREPGAMLLMSIPSQLDWFWPGARESKSSTTSHTESKNGQGLVFQTGLIGF